ncbi:MAG: LamG domain-containing protein [Planctomycetota bacterium]
MTFDASDDQVVVPSSETLDIQDQITMMAWIQPGANLTADWRTIMGKSPTSVLGQTTFSYDIRTDNNGTLRFSLNIGGWQFILGPILEEGTWYHVAGTYDGAELVLYLNGESIGTATASGQITSTVDPFCVGNIVNAAGNSNNEYWSGIIDEVRIWDRAISADEVVRNMESSKEQLIGSNPFAFRPEPADGAMHEATWANLGWIPGDLAVSHDLYFGTSFDDVNVNGGAEETFVGNLTTTSQVVGFPTFPAPEGLQPGTTYYWRIDEVNDADPNSPWKGSIWSLWIPSKKAWEPDPVDGAKYLSTDVSLTWTPGLGTSLHYVYFGDNFDEVSNATGALPQDAAVFTPGTLELETTYYWRVDEFDGLTTAKGDVWSFSTKPFIPITDPNLVCWWMLDEGEGAVVLDQSGHGHDGEFRGAPQWVDGFDGYALHFGGDGARDDVVHSLGAATDWSAGTVTMWVKPDSVGQNEFSSAFTNHFPNSAGFQIDVDGASPGVYRVNPPGLEFGPVTTAWTHLAVSFEGTAATLYYNGVPAGSGALNNTTFNQFAIGVNRNASNWLAGTIDELRVYDKVLSEEEIRLVMRIDPLLAWGPSPASGATPDVDTAMPLTWSAGDSANRHDVYFGLDRDAVNDADTSDTTGVFRGSQSGTSFTPAEGVEWGGGPYYWRVDENNTDGTVTKGRVWNFTVADFILVDDIESYTDNDPEGEAIWQHWIDGFSVPTNGAQAGYLVPPYTEQTIVNGGSQSMPLLYDNTAGVRNSEVELTLTAPRDWTRNGVGVLSLWFRGFPPSVGSFTEGPVGTFTMTAAGADIWGTADQFHFAYKTLTGPGTITARVDSITNTHVWAKAGVMIRETLDAGSAHAFGVVSAESGVASQGRTDTDTSSFGTTEAGIAAPHWVRLERDVAGNFTVSHSTNGSSWVLVENAVPTNIPMTSEVYVGLALTSHNTSETCEAKFSNVTITGNVGPQWMHRDIGILGNNAEPFYVALSNANGTKAVVTNEDADAAVTVDWTQWLIDLQLFADQGVNLADVDKIAIGLGATGDPTAAGGSGTMFIDDITLLRPAPAPQP